MTLIQVLPLFLSHHPSIMRACAINAELFMYLGIFGIWGCVFSIWVFGGVSLVFWGHKGQSQKGLQLEIQLYFEN